MNAADQVTEVLKKSSEALKSGEIADLSGIDKKEVDKIIKKMMNDGQLISPKRCYYELKK